MCLMWWLAAGTQEEATAKGQPGGPRAKTILRPQQPPEVELHAGRQLWGLDLNPRAVAHCSGTVCLVHCVCRCACACAAVHGCVWGGGMCSEYFFRVVSDKHPQITLQCSKDLRAQMTLMGKG